MSYLGIAISLFPLIVPLQVHFMGRRLLAVDSGLLPCWHTVFLLPIILMYTWLVLLGFRGKVRGDLGYH